MLFKLRYVTYVSIYLSLYHFCQVNVKYHENRTETAAKFVVSESVPPKFEIQPAEGAAGYILKDEDGHDFEFCAKYSHGGRVQGTLNVTLVSTRLLYR